MLRNNMMVLLIFIAGIGVVVLFTIPLAASAKIPYKHLENIRAGRIVYDRNCAGCHGLKLEGQTNWRIRSPEGYLPAPPHDETGHTWHHPDQMLFEFVKFGPTHFAGSNYKTIMPPYENILSDQEIWNTLAYIKAQWPQEIQQRHTEVFGEL